LKGIAAVGAFTALASAIVWYGLKLTVGIRVSPEEEREGLDTGEHGMEAYPGFTSPAPTLQTTTVM
jgi:Amt family ammonium transporter